MLTRGQRLLVLGTCISANTFAAFYVMLTVFSLDDVQLTQSGSSDVTTHRYKNVLRTTYNSNMLTSRSTRDLSDFGYIRQPAQLSTRMCQLSADPFLLILVCSAVQNFDRRQAIRQSWADPERIAGLGVHVTYVVAQPDGISLDPDDVSRHLDAEQRANNDLLELNFTDHYVNLTVKTVSALRWAVSVVDACRSATFRYVMKADDDLYVNVPRLVRRLAEEEETHRSAFGPSSASAFIMGHVIDSARPVRDRRSKWYTPESIYAGEFFPPYTSGSGYVMGLDVVRRLVATVDGLTDDVAPRLFWLEDIYVTGMLAARLDDVRLVNDERFNYRRQRRTVQRINVVDENARRHGDDIVCWYMDAITEHDVSGRELTAIWGRLTSNTGLVCDTQTAVVNI